MFIVSRRFYMRSLFYGLNSSATYSEMWKSWAQCSRQRPAGSSSDLRSYKFSGLCSCYYPAGGGRLRAEFLLFYIKYAEKYIPCIFDDGADIVPGQKSQQDSSTNMSKAIWISLITYIIVCTILELLFKLLGKNGQQDIKQNHRR